MSELVTMTFAEDRYEHHPYRRCGRSGLRLPAVSLGLWQNFGHDVPLDRQRQILRRAFDLGVTHIDLANNYGPPYGSAEENFGVILASDFAAHRDELVISTKAGYDMWAGPYGERGSRKHLLSSLDQSLRPDEARLRRHLLLAPADPSTPLEETMGALHTAVQSGRALYAGISSYSPERTREAARILARAGHAVADPPAVVLDVQPVDRGRTAGRPRRAGRRLHRVLAVGPGTAHRPLPRWRAVGFARRPGGLDVDTNS